MTFKQFKIKYRKMINILLIGLFITYFIGVFVYTIAVNERVLLKTDVVSKVEQAIYGGSARTRYDRYYLQNQDYYLERLYNLIPSIRIILERRKVQPESKILYYLDKNQIKKYENRKIKSYTAIGITLGENCPKNAWYWFTLLSYVQKSSNFFIASASLFILLLAFYRPATPIEKVFLVCMICYLFIWVFVF